jgi:signal transduction histidine kinase
LESLEVAKALVLPVAIRLPLLAAAMIFIVAVASTQAAVTLMGRQTDRLVDALGQTYLDGLSASLLPHVLAGDDRGTRSALSQAMAFQTDVAERRLVFIKAGGGPVIEIRRQDVAADEPLPGAIMAVEQGAFFRDDGSKWVWRRLISSGMNHGTVAANLDTSALYSGRSMVRWSLLAIDLAFSGLCAVAGFFIVRRIQRPVTMVATRLYDAALGVVRPIGPQEIPTNDAQAERMIHAFNAMVHAVAERDQVLEHLAEQQRAADLGRLLATVAHEVRNPLGGMRTAVSTLKRFGDQEQPRRDAVLFLERGISALQHVVDATLETYRARPEWRPLALADFEDLRLLIDADGRSRNVKLDLHLDIPDPVQVPALDVRQILLNLLLNAVRASSDGDVVELSAKLDQETLLVSVADKGRGIDQQMAESIEGGSVPATGAGLGVAVVIRLVENLRGRVSIQSIPGTGTTITLRLPVQSTAEMPA